MENTSSELDDSWGAGLPCDLARCIGENLDDLARICFRAVCRSWRAALPAGRVTLIPSHLVVIPAVPKRSLALPLLRSVVESCGSTSSSSTALSLHVVVDSELRCVGSSGGWLAVADSDSVIRLVNALTLREAACLPPLPRSARDKRVSSSTRELDHTIRDYEHTIHKVAFSVKPPRARGSRYAHSAAALHRATGSGHGLALTFTRAGWDHWMWRQPTSHLPFGQDGHFDVAYCQRSGVYYVVTLLASVWVLDMSAPVPTLEPLLRCQASPREFTTFAERRHIVVLSDDDDGDGALSQMYMVTIKEERKQQQKQRVIVQKYTAGEPWNVVSDLGGRALLIARRAQSMSVLPTASSLSPWLRPDCVYWMTHDEWYHDDCEDEEGMSPVWRFHVPTNTTARFFQEEQVGADYTLDWHNSLWLTPSLT